MAAYQKFGVITVAVILAILEKLKWHNYRLFIVYEELKSSGTNYLNVTWFVNKTDSLFDEDNVSQFLFRCLLLNNCLAVISCIYLTSWSDKHGRKLLLMLPYVGSFLSDIVMIIVLFIPAASSDVLLVSEGIDGFFGGTILMSLGCLCYITDSTDHRQRTLMIAIFFGLWNAIPSTDMTFQYVLTPTIGLGFQSLILCSVIYRMVCAGCFFTYIKLCVSESVFILGTFQGNPWTNLITPINVSDTFSCVFKRRMDNMRFYIITLTTIFILYTISLFVSSDVLLVSEGTDGFFGGTILTSLGCLCYITDSTDHRQRTCMIAIYFGLWNAIPSTDITFQYVLASTIGLGFQSLILCSVIYRMVCAGCFFTYIKLCVSESVFILGTFQGNPWTNLITPINVSDTFSCVFKRRMDNMRFYIITLTTIFILYTISLFGNIIIYPQYFRDVFLWPYKDVLVFSAIFTVCQTVTLWVAAYLVKVWKFLDTDFGMYGCASLAISCLALTFSKKSYQAVAGAIIGAGSLFVPVAIISVLTKLVERNETGSMFAGIGFITLMSQIIAKTLYSTLNEVCISFRIPQVIFLLSFGLISFSLFFFIYLKRNISPHLLGHLNGSESLALINKKSNIEQLQQPT